MPQRTNDFQKLIYLIRSNLADGATVPASPRPPPGRFRTTAVPRDVSYSAGLRGRHGRCCARCPAGWWKGRGRWAGGRWNGHCGCPPGLLGAGIHPPCPALPGRRRRSPRHSAGAHAVHLPGTSRAITGLPAGYTGSATPRGGTAVEHLQALSVEQLRERRRLRSTSGGTCTRKCMAAKGGRRITHPPTAATVH